MHAIIRIKKHKKQSLGSVDSHNRRLTFTPNANPDGTFIRMAGNENKSLSDVVCSHIENKGIKKHRKDAVVAVEVMLTASPEYFRPPESAISGKYGLYDKDKLKRWVHSSVGFLSDKYGENLVDYVLHLDEATPHIHAIVVPALNKEKKLRRTDFEIFNNVPNKVVKVASLDAKNMFDIRALYDLQEQYPKALQHLGLTRGKNKSKALHSDVSNYYNNANSSKGADYENSMGMSI
jgi:hypothetical protein